MSEKVNRTPIIAVIAASCIALLAFSILQFREKKDAQAKDVAQLAAEHAETAAVMKKAGEDADRNEQIAKFGKQQAYERSAEGIELKRLEAEDRAAAEQKR